MNPHSGVTVCERLAPGNHSLRHHICLAISGIVWLSMFGLQERLTSVIHIMCFLRHHHCCGSFAGLLLNIHSIRTSFSVKLKA